MNVISIVGRVGGEIKVYESNQGCIAVFSVATDDGYYSKAKDEYVSRTTWHKVKIFRAGLSKSIAKRAGKGDMVEITGSCRVDEYEKDGERQWDHFVAADRVKLLLPKKGGNGSGKTTNKKKGGWDDAAREAEASKQSWQEQANDLPYDGSF